MDSVNIMEVCGTHTMSIAKAGIKQILPDNIRLISGPGCPVCVTPQEEIDAILKLSENQNIIITTYGDMLRVPGSTKGDNLYKRKAMGANVEMVYSPMDAVNLAKTNPKKEVVFLGIGFETTAPGTAASIIAAEEAVVKNYSVLCMLKTVEPAVRKLAADPDFNVQGFLCPGHVAVILGEKGFRFITDELKIPAVIAGFEPKEIMKAITFLIRQIQTGKPELENAYKSVVSPEGNGLALKTIETVLEQGDALWRGLGLIEKSGLKIKKEYGQFDAGLKFGIDCLAESNKNSDGKIKTKTTQKDILRKSACRCGDIICGKLSPQECPMFGTACTPEDPEGPCMVSSEGACAAAYKYM